MAHVMNYQEILTAAEKRKTIYEELRLKERIRPLRFDGVDFVGVKDNCFLMLMECDEEVCMDYNLYYRCWNKMPSDEERSNAFWKEDPYMIPQEKE
jgi:hypothetical protein